MERDCVSKRTYGHRPKLASVHQTLSMACAFSDAVLPHSDSSGDLQSWKVVEYVEEEAWIDQFLGLIGHDLFGHWEMRPV